MKTSRRSGRWSMRERSSTPSPRQALWTRSVSPASRPSPPTRPKRSLTMRLADERLLPELATLLALIGPMRLRTCPLTPTPRQEAFVRVLDPEVFYGGAAGGGKSVALLMAAGQYSDMPGYH